MALFPITGRFVGDFVPHLVAVDTDDTMDQVAEKVAVHSVGRRVARPADFDGYDVLFNGELLAPGATLGSVMASREVLPLQWFDVRFRAGVPADA
ncbi:MAG: toluene-4-monooxygenase system B family protein [Trebonia sp.]